MEENATLLRGLAWACATSDDARLAAALADGAIAGYRKITNVGPRSAKVASACVWSLAHMPGLHVAAQLERVRLGVKQPTYIKAIEKALDEAARRAGMTREDLEELTVPTFELDHESRRQVPMGAAVAELAVAGLAVTMQWRDAAGKPRKAVPSDVQREHKTKMKDLQRLHDDMSRMLLAQRERLERLPLAERTWSLATWRERYLDHPLVGPLVRRLIWRFTDAEGDRVVDGCWLDGQLVDVQDSPLDLSTSATVSAWHPALYSPVEVLAWREWLERHQVTQPFKQAHREVYLLTDAERTTRVYSNRFAAHILRQHQFNALAAARGWRNQLRLKVDDTYPPATLELPHWGLRAEFWIEGAGDEYQVDTNETGTYLRVATDQVRFYQVDAAMNSAHAGGAATPPTDSTGTHASCGLEVTVTHRCRWSRFRRSSSQKSCVMWTSSSGWPASATTPPGRMAVRTGATATTGSPIASGSCPPPRRRANSCSPALYHDSPSPTAARSTGASCASAVRYGPTRFIWAPAIS
jgi:hypothetical protein